MKNESLKKLQRKIKNNRKITKKKLDNLSDSFCILCGAEDDLTKEHVIPRWGFEGNPTKSFITPINGSSQSYNKTVVPCCKDCNSNLLGNFEKDLKEKMLREDKEFSNSELREIIFWLEYIDYKFQILDLRRTWNKDYKNNNQIRALRAIPLSMLHSNLPENPEDVFLLLKKSLEKLYRKKSDLDLNSLLIFKTKNESFHFIHSFENFIFIELPICKIAFFYFIKERFKTNKLAYEKATKILNENY